jgi:predicted glutamine amidotransferase
MEIGQRAAGYPYSCRMCRLFGLAAPAPVTATFWLLDAPDSLQTQSHREPDGTGLGHFDGGTPRVDKQPLAAFRDREFAREARTVRSSTFVAHIRYASTGGLEARNTHPFEQRGRLFAHNGVVGGLEALERRIGADGMALVGGETDSERLFALITVETERRGGDLGAGIDAAVNWVADNLPVLSLNFVLICPGQLWALRYPDTHELHVLERFAGEALEQRSSHGTHVRSAHAAGQPTVVVASEVMDADPGWRMLRAGELLHVEAVEPETATAPGRLRMQSRVIRERPPARALSLAELEGRARASQA